MLHKAENTIHGCKLRSTDDRIALESIAFSSQATSDIVHERSHFRPRMLSLLMHAQDLGGQLKVSSKCRNFFAAPQLQTRLLHQSSFWNEAVPYFRCLSEVFFSHCRPACLRATVSDESGLANESRIQKPKPTADSSTSSETHPKAICYEVSLRSFRLPRPKFTHIP